MAYNTIQIPIVNNGASSFTERITLENNFYDFRFDWNERDTCWLMTLSLPSGDILIAGVKLVLNFELLAQHEAIGMPDGSMILYDVTGKLEYCGFSDLGTNCILNKLINKRTINFDLLNCAR